LALSTAFREKNNFENWIEIDQNTGLPLQYIEPITGLVVSEVLLVE